MNSGPHACLESLLTHFKKTFFCYTICLLGGILSNRKRNIKNGHTFAFKKLFKSIEER